MKWQSILQKAVLAAAALLLSSAALGQGEEDRLGLSIRTPVVAGQEQPAVVLAPTVDVVSVDLTVKRKGDGKQFIFNAKSLKKGSSKTFDFEQTAGKHAYEAHFDVKWSKGGSSSFGIAFEAESTPGLSVKVAQGDVDLDGRALHFTPTRAVIQAEVVVYGDDDQVLGRGSQTYGGAGAGKRQLLKWSQQPGTIRRLELKVTDAQGFWNAIEVRAFYVDPWEDRIYFATGSDAVTDSEAPKLEATLRRIREAADMAASEYGGSVDLRLYIAGYTDTVGSKASNQDLSNRRARSIGRYFKSKGLSLPIFYQGFGEDVLAVQTDDEVAEERNRRTLYVLSSQTPTSSAFPRPGWKRLD